MHLPVLHAIIFGCFEVSFLHSLCESFPAPSLAVSARATDAVVRRVLGSVVSAATPQSSTVVVESAADAVVLVSVVVAPKAPAVWLGLLVVGCMLLGLSCAVLIPGTAVGGLVWLAVDERHTMG